MVDSLKATPACYWLIVGLLSVTYVASYAFVSAIPDTNRDMFLAQAIASGTRFPLEGPILGGALHLGPIWYYLLSIPLALTSSWLFTCLFVGLIAALKFPLAFLCGRKLVSAELGVVWAVFLSMPGWNAYERLTIFNPNPAAAVVLGLIWLTLRIRGTSPTTSLALASGLTLGIGIHIHPTVAIFGLLPMLAVLTRQSTWWSKARGLSALAIGAVAPLLPYFFSQLSTGMPDASTSQSYVQASIGWMNIKQLPDLLWGYLVVGPYIALRHVAAFSEGWSYLGTGMMLAIFLLAMAGMAKAMLTTAESRSNLLAGIACTLVACGWILVLRPNTPTYFTYVLSPLFCGITAFGLLKLVPRYTRHTLIAASVLAVLFSIRIAWSVAATMQSGVGVLPSSFDVKLRTPSDFYVDVWFPAYAHGEMGQFLCSLPAGSSLHGPLAFIADWNVNTDSLLACGRKTAAQLGGMSTSRPITGMPEAFWRRLGVEPDCRVGSLGISYRAKPVMSAKESIALGDRYLPREFVRDKSEQRVIVLERDTNDSLLLTNYVFPYRLIRVEEISVNGVKAIPVAVTEMSTLYRDASPKQMGSQWRIVVSTAAPDGVDIVTIPGRMEEAGPRPATQDCVP